jgi:uncharacterized membrane protein YjfL (UPF0719 family)
MTNFHSIAGTFVWGAVAAILMLATFEPVSIERPVLDTQFSAAASAAPGSVA